MHNIRHKVIKGLKMRALVASTMMLSCGLSHAGWLASSSAPAEKVDSVTTEQVKKVLQQNPEIVYDALVAYQKQQA